MAKILIVDDDQDMTSMLQKWLRAEHHEVEVVNDGIAASEMLRVADFEIVVLDWDLPGKNGIEILRDFRKDGGQTPVIMLTGHSALPEKEKGFSVGVDDYLTKPFSMKELAMRIRAILRRPAQMLSDVLTVGNITLDPNRRQLTKDGVSIHLQPRDFSLLEFLMRHPDSMFSAEALLSRVWQSDSEASPEALRTAIKRIRKKVDDADCHDESNSIIRTVPRVGYGIRSGAKA